MTQNDMQVSINGLRDEQIAALKELLQEGVIKDRSIGGGRRVKYIKGDTAIDAANRIFGFGQWGYRVIARGREIIEDPKKGKMEMYTADIELSVAGASFTFPGDGVGIVNDPYTVEMHEKARKEAATDAVKRALRHYGDQFGLSLYNEDDYIEGSDGTLKQVKQAQPGRVQAPAPTRVVESTKAPAQIGPSLKQRLNSAYDKALALSLIEKGQTSEESGKTFLKWAAGVLGDIQLTNSNQLNAQRLDTIEAYLNSQDAA